VGALSEAPRLVDTCPDGIRPAMKRAAGSARRGVTVDQGCVLVNAGPVGALPGVAVDQVWIGGELRH